MNSEQFAYWLQGFFEISNQDHLTAKQLQIVKDHLATVFNKITPDRNNGVQEFKKYEYPFIPNDNTTIIC